MGFFSDVKRKVEEDMHSRSEQEQSKAGKEHKENHTCNGCTECTCGSNKKS